MKRGHLTIVCGPSGCGKSTLIKAFLKKYDHFTFPTSVTTRSPREGEVHGEHYFFMSKEDFKAKNDKGEFLEYADVYGQYYGTLKATIDDSLIKGESLIKDIDIQGAKSLMKTLDPSDLTSIFISPPSLEALKDRLDKRGSENESTLKRRLQEAELEMSDSHLFNHVIINDKLEQAYEDFEKILLNQ
ncbi:MAG: guanylate kinase [Planctomycetes bacterium]|nr:guanylate kinase [Planctomycetota bacterium]